MTEYTLPLSAATRNRPAAISSEQLLVETGARVILGEQVQPRGVVIPVVPSAQTLFGPRGANLMADGSLWVADTGHHRLLGWPAIPAADGQPANWLIGQPDFDRDGGRNAHGPVGAASLNVPTGICPLGKGMAVADVWNHRVLIWYEVPHESHTPADLVLGQTDFVSAEINRGAPPTLCVHPLLALWGLLGWCPALCRGFGQPPRPLVAGYSHGKRSTRRRCLRPGGFPLPGREWGPRTRHHEHALASCGNPFRGLADHGGCG